MRYVRAILFLLSFSACDTDQNTLNPNEKFFVKFYGDEGNHEGVDLLLNDDGSIILLGNSTRTNSTQQIFVLKVDPQGMIIWSRTYGTPLNENAKDIEVLPDGRLLVVGEIEVGPANKDVFAMTISQASGDSLQWIQVGLKNFLNQDTNEEVNSVSLIQGGFIVAGTTTALITETPGPNDIRDGMHLRFTNNLEWIDGSTGVWKNVTGLNNSDDVIQKIIEISPNEYYGFGYTNTDFNGDGQEYNFWVFSLGFSGVPSGSGLYLGRSTEDEILTSVEISPPEAGAGFLLSGITTRSGEVLSYIVKLQNELNFDSEDILDEGNPTSLGVANALIPPITKSIELRQSGFMLLSNVNALSRNQATNFSLSRLTNRLLVNAGNAPIEIGGDGNDFAANLKELPDGRILVMATMTLGRGGENTDQTKMVLMKLNNAGKLAD